LTQSRQNLDPLKEGVSLSAQGLTLLELDNPKASAQVDRFLATLAGDKQLSMAEVQSVANAGSFGQKVADSVTKFFEGSSGELSKQQKTELLEVLLATKAAQHTKERERMINSYNLTGAPKAQIEQVLGPELKVPEKAMSRLAIRFWQTYEPEKYDYRISSDGKVQRAPKRK
jgi:hypothetical protein